MFIYFDFFSCQGHTDPCRPNHMRYILKSQLLTTRTDLNVTFGLCNLAWNILNYAKFNWKDVKGNISIIIEMEPWKLDISQIEITPGLLIEWITSCLKEGETFRRCFNGNWSLNVKLHKFLNCQAPGPGPSPCLVLTWSYRGLVPFLVKTGQRVDTIIKQTTHHPTHHKLF